MEKEVYWSSIEFKTTAEHRRHREIPGGFVFVFLHTHDVLSLVDAVKADFATSHLEIVRMEFANPYDTSHQWESKEDGMHFKKLYQEAEQTGKLVYDELYSYDDFED